MPEYIVAISDSGDSVISLHRKVAESEIEALLQVLEWSDDDLVDVDVSSTENFLDNIWDISETSMSIIEI